ncbi:MAG TPA: aminodeoxychorismate synthase component I [Burkholderiales bacterium]|nr:aminodeoxychorismate synthase component I [Burkholderiales bacterium]
MSSSRSSPLPTLSGDEPFALLDDGLAPDNDARSRLFTGLRTEIICTRAEEVEHRFNEIAAACAAGRHVVALFDYELGHALEKRLAQHLPDARSLFRALVFNQCRRLDAAETAAFIDTQLKRQPQQPCGIAALQPNVSRERYAACMQRIHDYIDAGDVYQIDFTFKLLFDYFGDPLALYGALRARQPVAYGAFIRLPDRSAVLSFSPELFFRRDAASGTVTAKPMKGTARRGINPEEDAFRGAALAQDAKNRAENVMIVDLLRNDLGRIAQPGSVQVERLFEIEPYPTLLQMTSTIRAQVDPGRTPADLLRALFPCGSITGAPKVRAMEIINELESAPRGLYTGAIGHFAPNSDVVCNVVIRTLVLDGNGRGEMGVGGGIVYDSDADDEYAECLLKASFLSEHDPGFALIETLRCEPQHGYQRLDAHLERVAASAAYLGFACDRGAIVLTLEAHRRGLDPAAAHRVRLTLDKRGRIEITSAPLVATIDAQTLQAVIVSQHRTHAGDLLLRHKTTARALYNAELARAQSTGCFDALFANERGELTEGARSNVFVKLDGRWHTPPVSCGLLPGVMRAELLADSAFGAAERVITLEELRDAQALILTNSVRGSVPARIVEDPDDAP